MGWVAGDPDDRNGDRFPVETMVNQLQSKLRETNEACTGMFCFVLFFFHFVLRAWTLKVIKKILKNDILLFQNNGVRGKTMAELLYYRQTDTIRQILLNTYYFCNFDILTPLVIIYYVQLWLIL